MVDGKDDVLKLVLEKLSKKFLFKGGSKQLQSDMTSVQQRIYKGKSIKQIKTVEIKIKDLMNGELKDYYFDIITEKHKFQLDLKLQFLPQEQEKKFQALEELIVSDLCYLNSFSNSCSLLEIDSTAEALVNVFQWHEKSVFLLRWAIKTEVEKISKKTFYFYCLFLFFIFIFSFYFCFYFIF